MGELKVALETFASTISLSLGQLVAIIVGVIVALVVLICLLVHDHRKKKKKGSQPCSDIPKTVELYPKKSTTIKAINIHNIGKRESQQDSFVMSSIDNYNTCGFLALVADGMGGLEAGGESSAIAAQCSLSLFNEATQQKASYHAPDLLADCVRCANEEVGAMLRVKQVQLGGTTLVAAIIKKEAMDFVSVGDSRIVLIRSGALTVLNREHTYAVELDEQLIRGEISFEQAKNHAQRTSLTSYVGMDRIKYIDKTTMPMALIPGDRILLMSDGIFGSVSDEEILSALGGELYQGATALEALIVKKNLEYQDNFTAIAIEIGE